MWISCTFDSRPCVPHFSMMWCAYEWWIIKRGTLKRNRNSTSNNHWRPITKDPSNDSYLMTKWCSISKSRTDCKWMISLYVYSISIPNKNIYCLKSNDFNLFFLSWSLEIFIIQIFHFEMRSKSFYPVNWNTCWWIKKSLIQKKSLNMYFSFEKTQSYFFRKKTQAIFFSKKTQSFFSFPYEK